MYSIRHRAAAALLAAGLLGAAPAHAGQAKADACTKSLTPQARMIYNDALPDFTATTTIREVLTSHVRRLVLDGRIGITAARPAATAAAACLQALRD